MSAKSVSRIALLVLLALQPLSAFATNAIVERCQKALVAQSSAHKEKITSVLQQALGPAGDGYVILPTQNWLEFQDRQELHKSFEDIDSFRVQGYHWAIPSVPGHLFEGHKWRLSDLPNVRKDVHWPPPPAGKKAREWDDLRQALAEPALQPYQVFFMKVAEQFAQHLNAAIKRPGYELKVVYLFIKYNSDSSDQVTTEKDNTPGTHHIGRTAGRGARARGPVEETTRLRPLSWHFKCLSRLQPWRQYGTCFRTHQDSHSVGFCSINHGEAPRCHALACTGDCTHSAANAES